MEIAIDKAVHGASNGSVQVQASSQSGELKDFDLAGVCRSYSMTLSVAEFRKAARKGDILDRLYSTNNPATGAISTSVDKPRSVDTVFLTVKYIPPASTVDKYRSQISMIVMSASVEHLCPECFSVFHFVEPSGCNVPSPSIFENMNRVQDVTVEYWQYFVWGEGDGFQGLPYYKNGLPCHADSKRLYLFEDYTRSYLDIISEPGWNECIAECFDEYDSANSVAA